MSDLISRQDAIDALGEAPKYKLRIVKTYAEGRNDQWFDDVTNLSLLPSAQPEIIRCKYCKYFHDYYGNMFCTNGRAMFDVKNDSYCSYAERREE